MIIDAAAAGTWKLGDFSVNRMGFGAMRLTADPDPARALYVVRRAVELGVNHIDTAAFYVSPGGTLGIEDGPHRAANDLIRQALAPYPDDLVITTKVGPGRDLLGNFVSAHTKDELRGQVHENLRQLGLDRLDVVNLRIGEALDRGEGPLKARFEALAELVDEGLIRHLGISNVGPEHLKEALDIAPVVCVQNQYGLTTRREDDELVELCRENGVAFVPFFAVGASVQGAVPGKAADQTGQDAVQAVADAHGATPAQVRLAWTLHKGPHVLAIPGTGNPRHLEENVAAAGLRLTDEDMARLDTIG